MEKLTRDCSRRSGCRAGRLPVMCGLLSLERNGFGWGGSLEAGYPIVLDSEWSIEPQAQVIYQTLIGGSGGDRAAIVRFSDGVSG